MSLVVALSGSLTQPSRTRALVEAIGRQAAHRLGGEFELIDIAELATSLAATVSFKNLPDPVRRAQQRLQAADLLVIGSPVYKASYAGLLKHFLDLTDPTLLAGKVAVLAATGGSDRHALVIDHQLRPLASFFELNTVPAGVYARDTEFVDYRLASESTQARVDLAVRQALTLLGRQAPVALAA
jgi:FMN reductase